MQRPATLRSASHPAELRDRGSLANELNCRGRPLHHRECMTKRPDKCNPRLTVAESGVVRESVRGTSAWRHIAS